MSEMHWTGGEPECPHEHREPTVEGALACANCGALLAEDSDPSSVAEADVQVRYVLRGTLGGANVCGEWDDPQTAGIAAEGIRAHGGRAAVLKVTTEEVQTGVGTF